MNPFINIEIFLGIFFFPDEYRNHIKVLRYFGYELSLMLSLDFSLKLLYEPLIQQAYEFVNKDIALLHDYVKNN